MVAQFVLAAAGIWLMAAPSVLEYGAPAATSDRIAGPALASIGYLSAYAILRGLRWLNLATGGWLTLAPGILEFPIAAAVNSHVVGLLTFVLVLIGRPRQQRFGGGWVSLIPHRDRAADGP
ncbi:hypothetical protein NDR87_36400 [Nocardia sp. CDC159]|uniref:SPW repeat-containing integral membrane domain-containing protein n=1 Tax=Nocardia pulmonis TaxID=2951408 RepID=A0A9X2EEQ6_9NOCA|nr:MULTISPECIES: hypothetical protein [Nocardia]MCM6778970.1 hypothetical protein [Nocardia pulmonis]MCM6791859.1 hypothetical protein [Nocardia sp. CDC159]